MLDRRPLIEREANAKRFATVAILSCFLLPLFGCGIDDDFDPDLYAVDFADGAFVAVGQEYAIKNSVDGDDFRLQAVGDDGSLRSIAFGDGVWFGGGSDGIVVTSTDSATWFAQFLDTGRRFHGAAYGNGVYLVVGTRSKPPRSRTIRSSSAIGRE